MKKLLVIGIDGLSPQLMDTLIEKGIFSNIGRIKEGGTYGILMSTVPPITGPAWTTFATGVNPGKHGIYEFAMPRESLLSIISAFSRDIATKTFYELLDEQGRECILVNLPMTWPPLIESPTITSLVTRGESPVFPRSLLQEIPQFKDYRLVPVVPADRHYDADYVNDIRELERVRLTCTLELLKREWDFFFVLFSGLDWLSHYRYKELIAGTAEEEVWRFCSELDSYIGELCAAVGKEVNLLMVSDHGFGKKENAFYINNWLAKEGFLKKSTSKEMKMTKEGAAFSARRKHAKGKTIDVTRLSVLLEIPIISTLLHKPYRKLRRFLPFSTVDNRTIDPAETEAFCTTSASWGIYINEVDRFLGGCVEEESKEILLANLEEKLRGLKDPKTGENVLKEVFRKEEIYRGRKLGKAPDLILIPNDGWTFIASLTAQDIFETRERNEHDVEGIFTAFGPDIVEGGKAGKLFMQDIAPTILHMFGGPVYEYMDGKVRLEIFKDSSEFRSREVEHSEDTEAFIRKQPGAL